ncbi:MAG: D-glycero-beta-D-manno-heptose-7-phosphate kinase [Calditrichia bacterium]
MTGHFNRQLKEWLRIPKHIAVIGDVMIDEYLWGKVSRISPEAPVPIVEITQEQFRPGGSANVAFNLKSLNQQVYVYGVVGADQNGERLRALLEEQGLNIGGLIEDDTRPTTVKTRIIGGSQHIARVDKETVREISLDIESKIIQELENQIENLDAIVLEDYNKGVLTKSLIESVIRLAQEHDVIITVDPKFNHFFSYKNVTVFKPNKKETEAALQMSLNSREEIEYAGDKLLNMLQCRSVLITLGSKGMALFEKDKEPVFIPTEVHEVADVSGAGDTVIATITSLLAYGATVTDAMIAANKAAGIVCMQVGVVPITTTQLINAFED